ncbi:MAG: BatA domain-containing protein [Limisphaerales bacterium]
MTFLQPIVLWGLPLVLLPVLIHLINRMRHRPQPWAAMRFLLFATQRSMSHAKLRQFLVLLFRVLAVLMLLLFLGRPLAGGWLGWALSPAPDAIVILLDRSASMETQLAGTTTTRREEALKLITQTAREFEGASHLILIDSALRAPQEIATAANLTELSSTGPTDTAADLPAMVQSAVNWLIENRAGTAEIWIASDLQHSNWQPDDTRWKSVIARLESLPQKVRVRLLALNQDAAPNVSVWLNEVGRRQRGDHAELQFVLDLRRSLVKSDAFPLTITLDGARSQVELSMDGPALRWRHAASLGARKTGGWGSVSLPADANLRDNTAFFVYGPETPLRASVVSADPPNSRYFQLAAAASTNGVRQPAELLSPRDLPDVRWAGDTLLVWQDALPSGPLAERVRTFVEEGGVVIFFPPGQGDTRRFNGVGWGEVQPAETGSSFRINRWDEEQGPLAKTDEGLSLPLAQATFQLRQLVVGQKSVLAAFTDGAPFLTRQSLGRGEVFFCASLPDPAWSSLGEGPVLVPLLQRLLQAGSRRLQQVASVACGELSAADLARRWEPVEANTPKDIRVHAGVYRSGNRLMAVNRPATEDDTEILESDQARRLFGSLPFQTLEERRGRSTSLQGEIWRLFLLGMLLFLLVEGLLIRPPRTPLSQNTLGRATQPAAGAVFPETS